MVRKFRVFFGDREIGSVDAKTVRECIQKLELISCNGRRDAARRLCPGHALHGHVAPHRIYQGLKRISFPNIGVVYFDQRTTIPPAVTFREAPPTA